MRFPLPALALALALVAAAWPNRADAGCGCAKPPPPVAPVRPAFASPGGWVSLFAEQIVAGKHYTVTFGNDPTTTIAATAVKRRDFADGIRKPQLAITAPALPPGPIGITVKRDNDVVLEIPAADFTILPPPLALLEGTSKTLVSSYQTAVGLDHTVYFPLDISAIAEATVFEGRAIGYRLTFAAADVVIYNTQGVLMQLLDPAETELFTIRDDPDAAADAADGPAVATRSFELDYTRHAFTTYLASHDSNPDLALDPDDSSWHVDGTRHIDHFNLVVAISGVVDGTTIPTASDTPRFTFRVKTRPQHGNPNATPTERRLDAAATGATRTLLLCSAAPAPACTVPAGPGDSALSLRKRGNALRDQLDWRWIGAVASPRDFGQVQRRHGVAFCLYDVSTPTPKLLLESGVAAAGHCRRRGAGRVCWQASGEPPGTRGFQYVNGEVLPGGVAKLVLARHGKSKSRIALKTFGDRSPLPPLPLGVPVRAQLQSTNGACWEASYANGVTRDAADRFKATSD